MREKLTFSLDFLAIEPLVQVRARGKVGPRIKSYAWGTKINDFLQVLRGRGFSPTRFNSCLRDIQMVEVFGAGIAVHLSPKDLGLNARIWDCFRTVRDCFWTIWN